VTRGLSTGRACGLVLACLVVLATPVYAQRVVALAPLASLGAEDKSAASQQLTASLEQAIAALPGAKLVTAAHVAAVLDKAKRPQLKACEGDATCLAELGKLVGAQIVVTGEVGGLGESKVLYLDAIDVGAEHELRATTLAVGSQEDALAANAAMVRLLDPDRYKGSVHFAIDVAGATVFVNGARVALTADRTLALPVGTQAVRVTHPEYHDFVRFVDVPYGKTSELAVGMQQYPIIQHDVKGLPSSRDHVVYVDPPVWRRWYVVTPVAIALGVVTAIVVRPHLCTPNTSTCVPIMP
jgi:hypothetical protein